MKKNIFFLLLITFVSFNITLAFPFENYFKSFFWGNTYTQTEAINNKGFGQNDEAVNNKQNQNSVKIDAQNRVDINKQIESEADSAWNSIKKNSENIKYTDDISPENVSQKINTEQSTFDGLAEKLNNLISSKEKIIAEKKKENEADKKKEKEVRDNIEKNTFDSGGKENYICGYDNKKENDECMRDFATGCRQSYTYGEPMPKECGDLPANTYNGLIYAEFKNQKQDPFTKFIFDMQSLINKQDSKTMENLNQNPDQVLNLLQNQLYPNNNIPNLNNNITPTLTDPGSFNNNVSVSKEYNLPDYKEIQSTYTGNSGAMSGRSTVYGCYPNGKLDNFLTKKNCYYPAYGWAKKNMKARFGTYFSEYGCRGHADTVNACNPEYCGVAVSQIYMKATFGSVAKGRHQPLVIINNSNLKCTVAKIEDLISENDTSHPGSNAIIDLSYCVAKRLGATGGDRVDFRPLKKGEKGC